MVARNVYQRTISNWPGRSTKNSFEKIHFSLSLSLSAPFFEFYGGRFFFFVVVGWDILFWQRCIGKREIRQKKKKKKKRKGTDNLRLPSTRRFYDATAEFCLHDSTEASCSSATPVPPVFPSSLFFFRFPSILFDSFVSLFGRILLVRVPLSLRLFRGASENHHRRHKNGPHETHILLRKPSPLGGTWKSPESTE